MRKENSCWSLPRGILVTFCGALLCFGALGGCKGKPKGLSGKAGAVLQTDLWGLKDPPMPLFSMKILSFASTFQKSKKAVRAAYKAPFPPVQLPTNGIQSGKEQENRSRDKQFAKRLAAYYKHGKEHRLMLQTDKPLYQPGEHIWVRSVEVGLKRNAIRERTEGANYSLIGPRGKTIGFRRVPVYNGHSAFTFPLSTRIRGGEYTIKVKHFLSKVTATKKIFVSSYQPPRIKKKLRFLRKGYDAGQEVKAYIVLKRAAGQIFANRTCRVSVRLGKKTLKKWKVTTNAKGRAFISFRLPKAFTASEGLLIVKVPDAGVVETITRPIPLRRKELKLGFFPEGGHSVIGLPSRVYFACRRKKDDKPQDILAELQDSTGKVLAKVRSFHDGMGRFLYTPEKGKSYKVVVQKPIGVEKTFPLPKAKRKGISIQFVDDFLSKKKALQLIVHSTKARRVVLTALQHETLLAQKAFQLRAGSQRLTLPLQYQWRGILRLTVFGSTYRKPLVERLIFRNRTRGLRFEIKTDKASYQPRQKVSMKIKVKTSKGKLLKNVPLGLSVVDDTVLSYADDHEPNFLAQRFLMGALTGKIHRPNLYFSKNPKAPRGLDLVMGTHGWRAFSWKAVRKGKAPRKVRKLWSNAPAALAQLKYTHSFHLQTHVLSPKKRMLPKKQKKRLARYKSRYARRSKRLRLNESGLLSLLGSGNTRPAGLSGALDGALKSSPFGHGGKRAYGRRGLSVKGGLLRASKPGNTFGMGGLSGRGFGYGGGGGGGAYGNIGGFGGSSGRVYGRGGSARGSHEILGRWGSYGKRHYGRQGMLLRSRRSMRRRVRILPGRMRVRGSMSKAVISRVVRMFWFQIKFCYERQLRKNPRLSGKVVVRWIIGLDGRVQTANVIRTTLKNELVENCIVRRVVRWKFPRPRGGLLIVTFPFYFRSQEGSMRRVWRRYGTSESMGRAQVKTRKRNKKPFYRWSYHRMFPVYFYTQKKRGIVKRTDFRETLYWHPHLRTDAWGEASVSFGLNDKITSFRVRVTGVGGGELGVREHMIQSKRPFFMSVKIPQEVSKGDALALPVTLRNDSKHPLKIKLRTELSRHFKLMENPLPGTLKLPPRQARTYFFPIRVKASYGRGKMAFLASCAGLSDSTQRVVKVTTRGYPRELARSGALKPYKKKIISFELPEMMKGLDGKLELFGDPLRQIKLAEESMLREPTGCFEQTSSKNYPNIMLIQMMKSRGKFNPTLYRKVRGKLVRGYKRLMSYASKGGGFEWFGGSSGDTGLTAFGLLQFSDMRKVYSGVDKRMLGRTKRWLLSQRDGHGGYQKGKGYSSYSSASQQIRDAYITYALTEVGTKGIKKERQALVEEAAISQDPYIMSLALNGECKYRQTSEIKKLIQDLLAKQRRNGAFVGKTHSITRSYYSNFAIETTALALLAMNRCGVSKVPRARSLNWLLSQRNSSGGFGTTQATVLALKALVAEDRERMRRKSPGKVEIQVNGREFQTVSLRRIARMGFSSKKFARYLRSGKNKISIMFHGKGDLPYGLGLRYFTRFPLTSKKSLVQMSVKINKKKVNMGDVVRLAVSVKNTTDKGLPMTMARVAFPGGLTFQKWQLKKLKKQKQVDFYETNPRELILYFRGMKPKAQKDLHLDLIARVTGNFTGPASSAYVYYNNNHKHWSRPLQLSILP